MSAKVSIAAAVLISYFYETMGLTRHPGYQICDDFFH